MFDRTVYVSAQGLDTLRAELERLCIVKRPDIIERLHEAKEGSDWRDNSEYMLIQEELAFVEGRIAELERMLANARLIEPGVDKDKVDLGDTVIIQADDDEPEQYTIVGVAEADPSKGLISNESPLGRTLLDHRVGEEVSVATPGGLRHVRILSVTWPLLN